MPTKFWLLMGEARSKCQHLAGTPLKPQTAHELSAVTLIKGAMATTAIEGNTLTEDQVRGILDGTYHAPQSREYQEHEVRNVIELLGELDRDVAAGNTPKITSDLICSFNKRLLERTTDDTVHPGVLRSDSVGVGRYRGAPAADVPYLLDRLCEWLNSDEFVDEEPDWQFAKTLVKAVIAHLYIAWIHPFEDGNGRTARLLEFLILADCGLIPLPAAQLLSNHYNLTRAAYYRELDKASRNGGKLTDLLVYALQGFVDQVREQIEVVRAQQIEVSWINFVHETMSQFPPTKTTDRRRALVLGMPLNTIVHRGDIDTITPKVAKLYATVGPRTLSRDLNALRDVGLLRETRGGYLAESGRLLAFLPPIAPATE